MKQKKGFLLAEETLKIIIAVICIGFLAYLLLSIYMKSTDSKKLPFAKSTLNSIVTAIDGGQTSVDVYNPDGWYFDVWPQTVTSRGFLGIGSTTVRNARPLFCENLGWQSCICICKKNTINDCDNTDTGICVNNSANFDVAGKNIELKNLPLTLKIDYANKEINS